MFATWRQLFRPTRPARRATPPAFRPAVRPLEDRLAPAIVGTLSIASNIIWYNGANSYSNMVTVSTAGTTLTVSDAAGQISVTTAGSGFTGTGTGTVTGPIPSNVTQIIINGQAGTDIINLGAFSTTATLQVLGEVLNVTGNVTTSGLTLTPSTGGPINIGGVTISTAAKPTAADITFNGPVVLTAAGTQTNFVTDSVIDGNITFGSTVTGAGGLSINAAGLTGAPNAGGKFTANGAINVSGSLIVGTAAAPGANSVALNKTVNAAAGVNVTANNAVTLAAGLTTTGAVAIRANQDGTGAEGFSQTGGDIVTSSASTTTGAEAIQVLVNTAAGGTGGATVRGLTTGTGGYVVLRTTSGTGGGAIADGNGAGALNVSTGAGGGLVALSGAGGISLDTFTANLMAAVRNGAGADGIGGIAIRNTGLDLTVPALLDGQTGGVTTGGGTVTITNNVNHNIILNADPTRFVGTSGTGNVAITAGTTAGGASTTGSITQMAGSGRVRGDRVTLTATDSIGTAAAPILASGNSLVASTSLTTAANGINVSNNKALIVYGASANSGPVNLTTTVGNLTVAGSVTTGNGGAIALTSAGGVDVSVGGVASNTGNITITPTDNVRVATGTSVTTGGNILVTAPTANTVIDLAGNVTATGTVTVNGAGGALTTTLTVGGSVAAGGALTLQSAGSGATVYNLGGTLSGGSVAISGAGLTLLTMNGTLTSAGTTTISAGTTAGVIMTLSGTTNSTGNVTLNGASTSGTTFLNLTGPLTSGGAVAVNGGTSGALSVNQTAAVTGTTVTVTGSSGAANNITLGGPVTATTGNITVVSNSGATGSTVNITGTMSAVAGTTQVTGSATGADNFLVTPSANSTFTFTFGTGANLLVINTALSNILAADAAFAAPITFTAASGFDPWTRTAGTVTVSPTVP